MILQKLGEITPHKISGRLNVIDSAAPLPRKRRFQMTSEMRSVNPNVWIL